MDEKKTLIKELESLLPTLKQYELAEVDVLEKGPLEKSTLFFHKALLLFEMLSEEEKKKCPRELILVCEKFQSNGFHIHPEDREVGTSLKVPTWTLIIQINGEKFGVYTLGRVFLEEMKKALKPTG